MSGTRISLSRAIKVFENNEEKMKFLEVFNDSLKTLHSDELIRYVFKNLDNKIEHLDSLEIIELQKYRCVIYDCIDDFQIEILEYFRKRLGNLNTDYVCYKITNLEIIIYLESVDKLKIGRDYYKFVVKNNLVDIMVYLSNKYKTTFAIYTLFEICSNGRCDLLEIFFNEENIIEYIYGTEYFTVGYPRILFSSLERKMCNYNDDILDILISKGFFYLDFDFDFECNNHRFLMKLVSNGLVNKITPTCEYFVKNFKELKKYQYDYNLVDIFYQKRDSDAHSTIIRLVIYAACDSLVIEVGVLNRMIYQTHSRIKRKFSNEYFHEIINEILLKYSIKDQKIIIEFCNNL